MKKKTKNNINTDLEFLIELKENVEKGRQDITRYELAIRMIDDWIDELRNEIIDKKKK